MARLNPVSGGAYPRLPVRADLRKFGFGVAIVVFAVLFVQIVGREAASSASPIAAGTVVLGLGLGIAVLFGIARDSSIGVIVWLIASLFSVPYAERVPSIDRLAFMALVAGWFIAVVTHRRPLQPFGLTELTMLLFVLYEFGSALAPHTYPTDPGYPALQFITRGSIFPFMLFVIARQTMTDRRAVRTFLWFLCLYGLYFTLTAIFQKYGPTALVFPREILDPAVGVNPERARGPLLNSAADGITLVISFVATMYLAAQKTEKHRKVALFTALIMPVGIFLTETRAVWLAAGLAVVLGAMFAGGFRRWYLVVLALALTVIAVNWQKFLSSDRQQGGVGSVSEIESRLNDIATALWAIKQRPDFGWGIGRFIQVNTFHHQSWGDIDWNLGYGYIGHNTHLAITSELGYVGLALWAAVIISVAVASSRAFRILPRSGLISRGLVFSFWCGGLAWIINSSVIDVRLFAFVNGVIFTWAGIVCGLGDRARDGTLELDEPESAGGGPEDEPEVPEQVPQRPAFGHFD